MAHGLVRQSETEWPPLSFDIRACCWICLLILLLLFTLKHSLWSVPYRMICSHRTRSLFQKYRLNREIANSFHDENKHPIAPYTGNHLVITRGRGKRERKRKTKRICTHRMIPKQGILATPDQARENLH
jgi:hypothetical protein